MFSECALCRNKKELKQSHIIPKFIGEWLKNTSATGFLRDGSRPNLRKQDIIKDYLLCQECEEKLSEYEKKFSENIFIPFHSGKKEFYYDEWLIKFVISISWRVFNYQEKNNPDLVVYFARKTRKAIELWRKYLLGKSRNRGRCQHHIFFFDLLDNDNSKGHIPDNIHSYMFRGIDIVVNNSDIDNIFIYTVIPGIMIVSHVHPPDIKGWVNTKVKKRGKLGFPQVCEGIVGGLMMERVKLFNQVNNNISDKQKVKITETAMQNLQKVIGSKTLEMMKIDEIMKNRKR